MHIELLQPVLALVGLTFLAWLRLLTVRVPMILRGEIDPKFYITRSGTPPPPVERAATFHLSNLFEVPVLFYVLAALMIACNAIDPLTITLAWAYVGLRGVHTLIHLSYNNPEHRFFAYFCSCVVLMVMWLRFAGWVFCAA